jgi:hypothetical protein
MPFGVAVAEVAIALLVPTDRSARWVLLRGVTNLCTRQIRVIPHIRGFARKRNV